MRQLLLLLLFQFLTLMLLAGKKTDFVTSKIMGPIGTPVATKFRRNVILKDGTCVFRYVAPVLTRGKAAELPQPAGVGIIFKVRTDSRLYTRFPYTYLRPST